MSKLDATRIVSNLYQGSMPPLGSKLSDQGFGAVVLCAREYQPDTHRFGSRLLVLRVPLDDVGFPLTYRESQSVLEASDRIRNLLARGEKVLVTCMAGRNRSGLVVGTTLIRHFNVHPKSAIVMIRHLRRKDLPHGYEALTNPQFVDFLLRLR